MRAVPYLTPRAATVLFILGSVAILLGDLAILGRVGLDDSIRKELVGAAILLVLLATIGLSACAKYLTYFGGSGR